MSDTATQEREAERYPQIVRAIRETPWAILPGTLATIIDVVGRRLNGEHLSEDEIKARVGSRDATRPTQQEGAVAVIPIYGAIIPKATMFSEMSGGTSVQSLQADFRDALAAKDVKAIVFDIDSPGGMTDGIPELAAEIRAARGEKPIVAVSNFRAASAAYWLGSQADEFVASPSSDVGSIGVFAVHQDISAMNEKLGVKQTFISAGKYKVEGNPSQPLSDEGHAAFQQRVDEMYDVFAGDVAKGRGVSAATVKSGYGEGRMLSATRALDQGMVDRVATLEDVVGRLQNPSGRARVTSRSVAVELSADAIAPHSTATSDGPWDGPGNKARLNNDEPAAFREAYAWFDGSAPDPDGDGFPDNKGDYKFIHHEISDASDVGAANMTACSDGIAVLNGGRTGTTIPDGDRQGVYDHLAKHLKDGGKEPPPLKGMAAFSDAVDEAHRALESVVNGAEALRALTGVKRDQLAELHTSLGDLLAQSEETQDEPAAADEGEIALQVAMADLSLRGL